MRRKGRVDANQAVIVQALRDIGASVAVTSSLGDGFPDLVVGFRGFNYLLEVKDGAKPLSKRILTDDEQVFFDAWKGNYTIVHTVDNALVAIGAIS